MNLIKKLFSKNNLNNDKFIKSFVAVGDVIEVEEANGFRYIYKVEQFEVVMNNLYPPTDFVILTTFSYNNGISSTQCTSDNYKYVRHISHAKK